MKFSQIVAPQKALLCDFSSVRTGQKSKAKHQFVFLNRESRVPPPLTGTSKPALQREKIGSRNDMVPGQHPQEEFIIICGVQLKGQFT